jgi:hypothetical protein
MTETSNTVTVPLDTPIKIGDGEITSVELRKPVAGELRGLQLAQLAAADYGSLETLIPRISTPTLPKSIVATMNPADFMQIAGEIIGFLTPKSATAQ